MGIRFKVLAIVIITLGTGMGITTLLTTKMVTDVLLGFKADQTNLLADAITQNVQTIMITGNADLVEGLMADQSKLQGVKEFQLMTREGFKPFSNNRVIEKVEQRTGIYKFSHREMRPPVRVMSPEDPRLAQVLGTGQKVGYYEKVRGEDIYTQLIPLINEPRCHHCHGAEHKIQGVLRVSIGVQDATAYGKKLYWWLFGISWSIIGALSFLLYLLLKKTIINPITAMNKGMGEIAQGKLNQRMEVRSSDEIGNMAQNLNLMAQNLEGYLQELKKINQELEESESKYRLLFNSAKEGIYQVEAGLDGKITLINQAGAEIFGHYSPQDMIGKSFADCFMEREDYQILLEQLSYHGSAINYVAQGKKMTGEAFFLESTNHMVQDNTVSAMRIQGICRDITKRKEMEQKLIEHEKANAINKISSLFTHDLQNPVVGIKKAVELLKNQVRNTPPESCIQRIYEDMEVSCDLLLGMINEMLDIFRHDYDRLPLRLATFRLEDVISETVRLLRLEIEQKGIALERVCQPPDLEITADRRRLQRVLVNLLSNAIKYTSAGKTIWLSFNQTPDTHELSIKVEDEGPGIAEEELDKVFGQFHQSNSPAARPGTGLGLYFCRTVVQEHGGRIWMENRTDGGARFWITLPNPQVEGNEAQ